MVAVYILQIASYLAKITSQKGHFNDDTFIYQTKHLHL